MGSYGINPGISADVRVIFSNVRTTITKSIDNRHDSDYNLPWQLHIVPAESCRKEAPARRRNHTLRRFQKKTGLQPDGSLENPGQRVPKVKGNEGF